MTVASCATGVSYEKASDSLRSSGVCCESMAQFKYDQLTGDGVVSFKLDASSDAFNFESGKSYFKAFRLPGKALPYRVRIASFALGQAINTAHIFYPQVALLTDRLAIVSQSTPADFTLSKVGFREAASEAWALPLKLEGTVLVDNPGAKYVLVFTTRKLMSSTSPYVARQVIPIILPGLVTAVPGGKQTVLIQHSPYGLLHVEIVPAEAAVDQQEGEQDIEPNSAITARFSGWDAHLLVEAMQPGAGTTRFDHKPSMNEGTN
jgi:maltose operon protein